jgi:hypothetical protein
MAGIKETSNANRNKKRQHNPCNVFSNKAVYMHPDLHIDAKNKDEEMRLLMRSRRRPPMV